MLDFYSKGPEFNPHPSMVKNKQKFVFCRQLKWHAQELNSWHFGRNGPNFFIYVYIAKFSCDLIEIPLAQWIAY